MQIYKSTNLQKGTTIVELLIYLGLLAIFLTVLLNVFVTTLDFKLSSESTSTLTQDARYIFSRISYDVYNTDSFSVLGNSELNLVRNGVTTKYASVSGNLVRNSINLNSLDTKLQNLSFVKIGNTVRVSITLQSQFVLPGGQSTQTIDTTLGPR